MGRNKTLEKVFDELKRVRTNKSCGDSNDRYSTIEPRPKSNSYALFEKANKLIKDIHGDQLMARLNNGGTGINSNKYFDELYNVLHETKQKKIDKDLEKLVKTLNTVKDGLDNDTLKYEVKSVKKHDNNYNIVFEDNVGDMTFDIFPKTNHKIEVQKTRTLLVGYVYITSDSFYTCVRDEPAFLSIISYFKKNLYKQLGSRNNPLRTDIENYLGDGVRILMENNRLNELKKKEQKMYDLVGRKV